MAPYSGDSDQDEAEPGMVTINGSNAQMDRQAPGQASTGPPPGRALGDEVLPSIGGGQEGLARDFGEEAEPEMGQPVLEPFGFLAQAQAAEDALLRGGGGHVAGADFGEEEPPMEGVAGSAFGQPKPGSALKAQASAGTGLRSALHLDELEPEAERVRAKKRAAPRVRVAPRVQGADFDEDDPEAGPVTPEEGEGGGACPAAPLRCLSSPRRSGSRWRLLQGYLAHKKRPRP